MTGRSLQITYRKGRGFAAYLYRTEASPDGLLVVDYAADGRPIGVEITAPDAEQEFRMHVRRDPRRWPRRCSASDGR